MTLRSGNFTIIARCETIERRETRGRAASAMVLADRWAAAGLDDVTILDARGIGRGREAFRKTLPGVRKAVRL